MDEKKTKGHNWKDFEVDTLIAIQKEMDAKFSRSAKKKVCFWIFFDFAKNIQLRPLWPWFCLVPPFPPCPCLRIIKFQSFGERKKTYTINLCHHKLKNWILKIFVASSFFLFQIFLTFTNSLLVGILFFFYFQVLDLFFCLGNTISKHNFVIIIGGMIYYALFSLCHKSKCMDQTWSLHGFYNS